MDSPDNPIGKNRVSRIPVHNKVQVQVVWRWSAVILWMTAIFAQFAIASIAAQLQPVYDFTFKKFAHVTVYAILTAFLFRALRIHIGHKRYALLTAVLSAILFACFDEWHQTFVPGRQGMLRDVAIDALGVAGMSIWLRIKP